MASTDDGVQPRPYKIKVKSHKVAGGGEMSHVMMMEKISMDKVNSVNY